MSWAHDERWMAREFLDVGREERPEVFGGFVAYLRRSAMISSIVDILVVGGWGSEIPLIGL
jgi:hypothetical protein